MDPIKLASTIYLGDRGVKKITIDGWEEKISITITTISRIRSESGQWDYYNDEDIENGDLVFNGVKSIIFDPPGYVPNDYIYGFDVKTIDNENYLFDLLVDSGDKTGKSVNVKISIIASGFYLYDPNHPDLMITD